MRINNNAVAYNAYRNITTSEGAMGKSLEKLSSGYRINRAADDAAGLVISQKLRATVSGLKVAVRNVQDGISIAQIADGTAATWSDVFQRMRDLAVAYENTGTTDATAQGALAAEYEQLKDTYQSAAALAKFGDKALFNGSYVGNFQVGADAGDTITIDFTGAINPQAALDAYNAASSYLGDANLLDTLDAGIKGINSARAYVGSLQNRLESTLSSLQNTIENLGASESRIRDTDMAQEMVSFTRHQIMLQAGTAMLAQANTVAQSSLRLLQ